MNGYKKEDVLVVVFLIAFLISVWFLCVGRTSVYNLRIGADSVRGELNDAKEAQQREAEAIGQAGEAAGRSTAAISNSQRTTEKIKRMERKDAEIIDECQSILARVRERNQEKNPEP